MTKATKQPRGVCGDEFVALVDRGSQGEKAEICIATGCDSSLSIGPADGPTVHVPWKIILDAIHQRVERLQEVEK